MRLGWPHWLIALTLALVLHAQAIRWWPEAAVNSISPAGHGIELHLTLATAAPSDASSAESQAAPPEQPSSKPQITPESTSQPVATQQSTAHAVETAAALSPNTVKPKSPAKPKTPKKSKPEAKSAKKPGNNKPAQATQQSPASKPERLAQAANAQAMSATRSAARSGGASAAQPVAVDTHTIQRDYVAKLSAWINRHKRYPRQAQRRRQEGTVKIRFALNRGGQLLNSEIMGSSGHAVLDRAALDILKSAAPLPPIPRELSQQRLEVILPIAFDLR